MIKKVILHIGSPKTGTSIIQSHLAQNREILKEKGVLYPITISSDTSLYRTYESHHLLFYSYANWEPFNKFDPKAFWERAEEAANQHNLDTVLLSAENAYWLPRQIVTKEKPDETLFWEEKSNYVARIYEDLKIYDSKVIIYLRRQDRWIESWYNQQIKNGNYLDNDMLEFTEHHHFLLDYYKLLNTWSQYFGRENITVRPYEKDQFPSGLLNDFLEFANLGSEDDFPLSHHGRHNSHLDRHVLEFLNICNKLLLTPDHSRWLRLAVRKVTNQFSKVSKFTDQGLISPQDRMTILERYQMINSQVAKEYMGRQEGDLFHEALTNLEQPWHPYQGLTIDKAMGIMIPLLLELKQDSPQSSPNSNTKPAQLSQKQRNEEDLKFWQQNLWHYEP